MSTNNQKFNCPSLLKLLNCLKAFTTALPPLIQSCEFHPYLYQWISPIQLVYFAKSNRKIGLLLFAFGPASRSPHATAEPGTLGRPSAAVKIGILRESHLPGAISTCVNPPSRPFGKGSVCILLRTRDDYVALTSEGPVSA